MTSLRSSSINPKEIIHLVIQKCSWVFPSELFLKSEYYFHMGKMLDLKNPTAFSEKLQWLKLHDHNPIYHTMVDKYAVKDYISRVLGSEYVIPLLGDWDKAADIEWDRLPNQFVIKATHSGGGGAVFVCKDKESFNRENATRSLQLVLDKIDLYKRNMEWAYKDIPHRIIAEQYIEDSYGQLNDYKFFCFNGVVKFFKIDFGRFTDHHANYYDRDCNLLPFGEADFPPIFNQKVNIPDNIEEMIAIAERLSKDNVFLRVDLYNVDGRIYFGEMTFYPASGFGKMIPEEWDKKIGDYLDLNEL